MTTLARPDAGNLDVNAGTGSGFTRSVKEPARLKVLWYTCTVYSVFAVRVIAGSGMRATVRSDVEETMLLACVVALPTCTMI